MWEVIRVVVPVSTDITQDENLVGFLSVGWEPYAVYFDAMHFNGAREIHLLRRHCRMQDIRARKEKELL